MISSMTAFGRVERMTQWGAAVCEIRTVNHRYIEIAFRLPEDLRSLEAPIRDRIAARMGRGKVDCSIRLDRMDAADTPLDINRELLDRILLLIESITIRNATGINPMDVLRWPGVLVRPPMDIVAVSETLLRMVDGALDAVVETRRREGEKIHARITDRCEQALGLVRRVRQVIPQMAQSIRDRFMQRALDTQVELNNDRLEQEMLLLAQKMDVAEELDRLEAHISEVARVIGQRQPVGRRLDFLMQEMNREANTLGSKAGSVDLSNACVDLKVLIEQMREQIQNIE